MKLDIDKAQAMSLNIEQERREFCNAVRADESIPYDIRKSLDDGIMAYMPAHFDGWLAAKLAAHSAGLSQEPVALQHMAVAEDGVLRWMSGRKIDNCELYAMPDFGRAPSLYTAPPAPVSAEPEWHEVSQEFKQRWPLNEFKTKSVLERGYQVAGYILLKDESISLCYGQAVRWLSCKDFFNVMHSQISPAAPLSDAKDTERRGHYDDAKLRDIGAEAYRACGELPFGYEIIIELENGAGSVTLCDPDGEKQCFEDSDYFANDIRNAIDAAIAAAKGDME